MDQLAKDMKENTVSRRKEESGTSNVTVLKMKGKMEDMEVGSTVEHGTIDKSKYKMLEMPIFNGVNTES